MKYTDVKNLQWTNEERSCISMLVSFDGLGEIPFTANANDVEAHGRELFKKALNGDFGAIQEMPEKSLTQIKDELRLQVNKIRKRFNQQGILIDGNTYAITAESRNELRTKINDAIDLEDEEFNYQAFTSLVTLNIKEGKKVLKKLALYVKSLDQTQQAHLQAIEGLNEIEQAKSYLTSTGWEQ